MKTSRERELQVLNILSDNLKNPQPQAVSIERIAGELRMHVTETRHLLLRMDQTGIIKCDSEGNLSIITREGLCWRESVCGCRPTGIASPFSS